MLSLKRWLVVGAVAVAGLQAPSTLRAAETGTIEGQFVYDGEAPKLPPRVAKGDATARDAATCAADEVPDETLVVDPATKGIANVIVYLRKAPADMPAELKVSKSKELTVDQKGCRYFPHVLAVRTDQKVTCISSDPVAHNVNIAPFINEAKNFVIPANDKNGTAVTLTKAEALPVNVKCDIHPWMQSYWVVTDHPYAAVTDKEGKFKIEGLPVGEHSFTVWQESAGYVDRAFKVTVKAGTQTLPPVKVAAAKFKKK
jgi:plastocyanin